MRHLLLCTVIALAVTLAAHAQLATYSPLNGSFQDSITLFFNLNLSQDGRSAGLKDRNSGLYLWMGAGTAASPFAYQPAAQKDFAQPVMGAELSPVGANLWQIKLHAPSWCRVPAGQTIEVLGLIVKNADGSAQTEDIILTASPTRQLQNAVVRANKPLVEKLADRTVLNIQNDVVASAGTLFEAIQRAPGLSVTNDENLIMSGKSGVLVLIDGRPTQLSQRDLANWLKSTPASLVASIDIINNPSAKYDAQGNAGIINIKLKKNTQQGLNGNLNTAYTQAQHYRTNSSANLNYRQGALNLYGNASYSHVLQHTNGSLIRQIPAAGQPLLFDNRTTDIDRGRGINYRLGADWYLNKKTTLGLLFRGNDYSNPMETLGSTVMWNGNSADSSLRTRNENRYNTANKGYNLNYRWLDSTGAEWNLDADYTRFSNQNGGLISTGLFGKNGQPTGTQTNDLRVMTNIDLYTLRADYTRPLKRWRSKLETGAKWTHTNTRNNMQAWLGTAQPTQPDTGRTNDFRYTESIYAAYLNLQRQHGRWNYQLSVRAEATVARGNSLNLRSERIEKPDTSYLNLFPSAFVRYTLNDKNSLGLSASRRINRPSFQDLNPFEYLFDKYSSERGNPYLRPSYLSNVELNYNYGGALDITIGYSRTNDYFQTVAEQNGAFASATTYNVGRQHNWFANLSLGIPIRSWWFSYNSINSFYNVYKGQIAEGAINNRAFGMGWYTQQSLSLKKDWKLQLSSWGNSGTRDALFKTSWLGSIDIGVQKAWAKGKWNARLAVNDVFNTQRWQQRVQFADMQFTYYRKWESRGVSLQLNWKFGKTNYQARQRSRGNEAEEGRIKAKS